MSYELPNYEINRMVASMIMHSPVSNKCNRGDSYEQIATKYVDITVRALLDSAPNGTNQYRIWLTDLRSQHSNKYGVKRWYDFLREQYPIFAITGRSHKHSSMPSLVVSTVSQTELIAYAYHNRDRMYNMTKHSNTSVAVPIDVNNLKNFVDNNIYYRNRALAKSPHADVSSSTKNIIDGSKILGLAAHNGGVLQQSISLSDWPRQYLSGLNLQSTVRSETRHAALGKCYKYDINSSAIAFMATEIMREFRYEPKCMMQLLNQKKSVRNMLAYDVFKDTKNTDLYYRVSLIKQAINSMGFGSDPNNSRGGLSTIIMNRNDRKRFQQHEWVKQFGQEVQLYERLIRAALPPELVKQNFEFVLKGSKYNVNSVAAYAYQYVETEIMRCVLQAIGPENVLLWVHDCFYSKKLIDPYELNEISAALGYPLMKFSRERIDPIDFNKLTQLQAELISLQHYERIAQEELMAAQYVSKFVDTDTGNTAKHHIPYPVANDDELTVLWEEYQNQQLREINPLYTKE